MRDDVESAFPYEDIRYRGMSLRDYFAAKAMNAQLVTIGTNLDALNVLADGAEQAGHTISEHVACHAYELADAMLIARQK